MRLPGPLTEKEHEGVTKTLAYLRQQADASLTASLPHYAASLLLAHLDALAADRGREEAESDIGYGNCPVQIEGEIGDRQYYFRARGTHFELCVGEPNDKSEFAAVSGTPIMQGTIDAPFAAGWMPHNLAKMLTDWALGAWERETDGTNARNASEMLEAFDTKPEARATGEGAA